MPIVATFTLPPEIVVTVTHGALDGAPARIQLTAAFTALTLGGAVGHRRLGGTVAPRTVTGTITEVAP